MVKNSMQYNGEEEFVSLGVLNYWSKLTMSMPAFSVYVSCLPLN